MEKMSRREMFAWAAVGLAGGALKGSFGEGGISPSGGLLRDEVIAEDAARIYTKLWDGLKERDIPCDDRQFSDLYREVVSCCVSGRGVDCYGRRWYEGNVETVLASIDGYLDHAKKEYTEKGEPLPYGQHRDQK